MGTVSFVAHVTAVVVVVTSISQRDTLSVVTLELGWRAGAVPLITAIATVVQAVTSSTAGHAFAVCTYNRPAGTRCAVLLIAHVAAIVIAVALVTARQATVSCASAPELSCGAAGTAQFVAAVAAVAGAIAAM